MSDEKTTTHSNLATALAAAQAEMVNPVKNATNPHFRSRYADLSAVRDAVIPVLARHGVATIQDIDQEEGLVRVRVVLMHGAEVREGPWASSRPRKDDPQAVGSVITYLRRYTLAATAGVAPDDDDDGNAGSAEGNGGKTRSTEPRPRGQNPEIAAAFAEAIDAAQDQDTLDKLRAEVSSKVRPGEDRDRLARAWAAKAKMLADPERAAIQAEGGAS